MKILVYCNGKEVCPISEITDHNITYGNLTDLNNHTEEMRIGYDVVLLHLEDLAMVNEFTTIIKNYNLATNVIVMSNSYIEGNEFIKHHNIYSYIVDDASALGNLKIHLKNIEEELFTE